MSRAARRAAWALFPLAAAVFLGPVVLRPAGIPFSPGATFTDLLTAHLPSALFLHRALQTWHTIPLWNPTMLSGIPFAADPLSGLWYPPLWLAALWPAPVTFNLLVWAHVAWAGYGMESFLRRMGLSSFPSLVGALAFMGTPKLIGHVGLGHISLVLAVCWMPWVLLATRSAVTRLKEGGEGGIRAAAYGGAALALVFLIDPRWSIPSAAVAVVFAAATLGLGTIDLKRGGRRILLAAGAFFGLALVGSAGLALPLLEWLRLSTRAGLVGGAPFLPLPPANLLGLLVPRIGGSPEWIAAVGVVVLMLAVVGFAERPRDVWLWAGFALTGWILALGDTTLIGRLLGHVPGWNLVRVPPRWLFVSALGVSVLTAHGAEAIFRSSRESPLGRVSRLSALAVAMAEVGFGLGLAVLHPEGSPGSLALLIAPVLAVLTYLVIRSAPQFPRSALVFVLVGLVVVDLGSIDSTLLDVRWRTQVEVLSPQQTTWLHDSLDGARVFSPSYAIPQDLAAREGVELADGVHPLPLRSYVEWMAGAAGFDAREYTVTLPPFPNGDPAIDWHPDLDPEAMGLLAVGYAVSRYPMALEGWSPAHRVGDWWVYKNPRARPYAWVEDAVGAWSPAAQLDRSPNRIAVVADGPGQLVLSDISYPGWRATVDGRPAAIETRYGLLRAVRLDPGRHLVAIDYRPMPLLIGSLLTLFAAASLVLWWRRGR